MSASFITFRDFCLTILAKEKISSVFHTHSHHMSPSPIDLKIKRWKLKQLYTQKVSDTKVNGFHVCSLVRLMYVRACNSARCAPQSLILSLPHSHRILINNCRRNFTSFIICRELCRVPIPHCRCSVSVHLIATHVVLTKVVSDTFVIVMSIWSCILCSNLSYYIYYCWGMKHCLFHHCLDSCTLHLSMPCKCRTCSIQWNSVCAHMHIMFEYR